MNVATPPELFLNTYQAVRFLGEGGMGQILLGRHRTSGQEVVIKLMRDQPDKRDRLRLALQREMRAMKRFRHPYAVALLDGDLEVADNPCMILEYVRGVTLESLLERTGPLEPKRVGRLLGQLCQVLHAAHGAGILHRDLSTANLMVVAEKVHPERGEHLKVMDFGLARLGTGFFVPMEQLTSNSIGGGTPDFMCPEQIRGEGVDHRGDIYSAGVILFKMLTGHLPFGPTEDTADILLAHVQREPYRFEQLGIRDVPEAVEEVVRQCLEKYPNQRPQSARELAERFGQALGLDLACQEDFPDIEPDPSHEPHPAGLELDRFEAWMPEQIAVMKLRAFIGAMGGDVVASEPGSLRVSIRDPRVEPETRGLLSFLGLGRKTLPRDSRLLIELRMEKKQAGGRGLVEIQVRLPDQPQSPLEENSMRRGFAERICRELRAYLMIGR